MPQDTSSKDGRELHESTRDMSLEDRGSANRDQQLEADVNRDLEQQQEPVNHLNVASHGSEEGTVTGSDVQKQEVSAIAKEGAEEHTTKKKKGKEEVVLQDQTNQLPTKQVIIAFLALGSALFLAILDQTLVATALPSITQYSNGGAQSTWVATAYLLTSTAFQPLYGRFSDIFGRKIMLLASLAIFTVFSLACAVSQTLIQLIVFRALAGIGGAGIATLALIIVSDIVSLRRRGKFQGILGAVIAIAQGIGPLLGSVFSQKASWRFCFWINLPIGVASILICAFVLPLKRVKGDMKTKLLQVDYGGSTLVLAGAILLLVALNYGGQALPWDSALVLSTLLVGVALCFGLVLYEWKVARIPIIPLKTFKNRTVAGVYAVTFALGAANFIPLFYIPQYFQVVRGFTAINAGLMLLPLLVVQVIVSWLSGILVQKTGHSRPSIICGYFLWSIGSGLLSSVDVNTPTAHVVGFLLICGFGAGQTFQTSLVLAQAASPKQDMASVTSFRNFVRTFAGTLLLAIASSVVNNSLRSEIRAQGLPPGAAEAFAADPLRISSSDNTFSLTESQRSGLARAFTNGIQVSYYVVTAILVVAFFISVFILQHHSLTRDTDRQDKADAKKWLAERQAKKHHKGEKDVEGDESV